MDRIIGPSANKFNATRVSGTTENANCEILINEKDGKTLKDILTGHNVKTFNNIKQEITKSITDLGSFTEPSSFTAETAKKFFENLKTFQQKYENAISGDIDIDPEIQCNLFENNKYNEYKIKTIKKSLLPISRRDTVIVIQTSVGKPITKTIKFDKICIETVAIKDAREKHNKLEAEKNTASTALAIAQKQQKDAVNTRAKEVADEANTIKVAAKAAKAAAKKAVADAKPVAKPSMFANPFASKAAKPVAVGGGKKRHSHRHHQKHNIKSSDISICE